VSKWFEVKVTTVKVWAVEVDDDEDADMATEYVLGECSEWTDVDTSKEITDPVEIDRLKRHADEVLDLI
jgi:hypothetical protein